MVKKSLAIAFFLLAVAIALSVALVIIAEDEDGAEGATGHVQPHAFVEYPEHAPIAPQPWGAPAGHAMRT